MNYSDFVQEFSELLNDPGFIAAIYIIIGMFVGIILLGILFYIINSIALYRIAVNRGIARPGLAWIPVIGNYRIGVIADDISAANGNKTYFGYIMLIGMLVTNLFSIITNAIYIPTFLRLYQDMFEYGYYGDMPMPEIDSSFVLVTGLSRIASLLSLVLLVIMVISYNKIYKCYNPQSSTAWTVLSVLFPFLSPFFLFALRNRAPVPVWQPQVYYGDPPPVDQNWQMPPQYQQPVYPQQPTQPQYQQPIYPQPPAQPQYQQPVYTQPPAAPQYYQQHGPPPHGFPEQRQAPDMDNENNYPPNGQ